MFSIYFVYFSHDPAFAAVGTRKPHAIPLLTYKSRTLVSVVMLQ